MMLPVSAVFMEKTDKNTCFNLGKTDKKLYFCPEKTDKP